MILNKHLYSSGIRLGVNLAMGHQKLHVLQRDWIVYSKFVDIIVNVIRRTESI